MISIETRRQLVHLGVVVFALPVPFLGAKWAVVLCLAAVLLNWVILPVTGLDAQFRREGERFVNGVRVYPLAVLGLFVLFPLSVAQGTWAVLAVGDSFSNICGRRYGRKRLPWNPRKSWAGSAGFVVFAFPAAVLTILYTEHFAGPQSFLSFWQELPAGAAIDLAAAVPIALAGAVVGSFVESLPVRLDDNVTVSIGSAVAMVLTAAAVLA